MNREQCEAIARSLRKSAAEFRKSAHGWSGIGAALERSTASMLDAQAAGWDEAATLATAPPFSGNVHDGGM
jgi:hypothetical protein